MKKTLNLLTLSMLIFSFSILSAATVNFPIDQPVIQKIEEWSRKIITKPRFGYVDKGLNYRSMQTILTLKEIDTPQWNLEAYYLEGWLGKEAAPDDMSLITVKPFSYTFTNPSHISTLVTGTIGDSIISHTYGRNNYLDTHLSALWYLHERELAVGDKFTVDFKFGNEWFNYEILSINDETVEYSVEIVTCHVTLHGQGFWNRNNGLVGEFSAYGKDMHEVDFRFSSFPQE